jgi:potassium-dependent mechanosensitive channel
MPVKNFSCQVTTMTTIFRYCRFLAPILALFLASITLAQTKSDKPPIDAISVEIVQSRLKQIDDSHDLDDAVKIKIHECFQQAIRELDSSQTWLASATRFEQMAASAADDLTAIKTDLANLPAKPSLEIPDNITLPQIDQLISKKQSELDEYRARLVELEAEPNRRANRRVEIPKAAGAARDHLAQVDEQLQVQPPVDEPAALTAARRTLLQAQHRAVEYEIQAYEKEISAYEATSESLPLRRDLSARRVALADREIKQWQATVNQRRQQEAEKQLQQAKLDAARAHPAIKRLAQENAALADTRKKLAEDIANTTKSLEKTNKELAELKDQFKKAQEKVKAGGMTNAIGLLLRKQRETLPNVHTHRRDMNARQTAISESQLSLLQLQDRRSVLDDLEQQVHTELQNLNHDAELPDSQELENAIRESLQTEKNYLVDLIGDQNIFFYKSIDLQNAEGQLINEADTFATYIDERVLWIASASFLNTTDVMGAGQVLWKIAGPNAFKEAFRALAIDFLQTPPVYLLAMGIFGPLFYYRRRMREKIHKIGELAAAPNCCRMTPTIEALFLTLLIAAIWPGILAYLSWRMTAALDASEFCKAIGTGLAGTALVNFVLELLRHTCRMKGLGEAHLGWPSHNLKLLRHHLKWLNVVVLPQVFIVATLHAEENERWNDSLGRLCFIAAMLLSALFLQRILRPSVGVFQEYLASRRGGWMDRLRYVWYPAAVLLPLSLAGLAGAGYYYTSQQLASRMVISIYMLLGLFLLGSFLLRWVQVNRRKMSMAKARRRRATLLLHNSADADATLPAAAIAADGEQDLAALNLQTRRLVEHSLALAGLFAIWCIWVDVLPALGFLNSVEVWKTTVNVSETVTKTEAVTLAHLCLAILVLMTTFISARNIPGLLEMSLLHHLPVDAGVRYAVATVSRYMITIVGTVLTCNTVGLGWSKVQWLVAAVSVGLGFGLQEIFANFVSGLIILVERPIRVGDVITISDVTGTVSRIRMRATTIVDGDRKELIIPNKDVITGRVLNWTLSDQVNRIQIKVGIAYGSNTEQAANLLMRAAQEHTYVLDDPKPQVTFEAFGKSAMEFVLCCYLPNLEKRSKVLHELHMAIDHAFRTNAIEIAYPQQDIHVRTIDVNLAQFAPAVNTGPWIPPGQTFDTKSPKRDVA